MKRTSLSPLFERSSWKNKSWNECKERKHYLDLHNCTSFSTSLKSPWKSTTIILFPFDPLAVPQGVIDKDLSNRVLWTPTGAVTGFWTHCLNFSWLASLTRVVANPLTRLENNFCICSPQKPFCRTWYVSAFTSRAFKGGAVTRSSCWTTEANIIRKYFWNYII